MPQLLDNKPTKTITAWERMAGAASLFCFCQTWDMKPLCSPKNRPYNKPLITCWFKTISTTYRVPTHAIIISALRIVGYVIQFNCRNLSFPIKKSVSLKTFFSIIPHWSTSTVVNLLCLVLSPPKQQHGQKVRNNKALRNKPKGASTPKTLIRTRCEGGEAAPMSLLCRVPCLGLGAGLPQGQGEMLGGDPGWTQQSHHVQAQRQKDAQQSDELEGPEHVHLVHGHLLTTGRGAAGQSRSNELGLEVRARPHPP